MTSQDAFWAGPHLLSALQRIVLAQKKIADIWEGLCGFFGVLVAWLPLVSFLQPKPYRKTRASQAHAANRAAVVVHEVQLTSSGLDDVSYLLLW